MDFPEPINALHKVQSASSEQISTDKDPQLWKVVKDFESILIYHMLKTMRETISKSELTEEAPGKEFFESLFDQEMAGVMAKQDNSRLAESLYRQLAGETIRPSSPVVKKSAYDNDNMMNRLKQYDPIIGDAARKYNVDKRLISAVIMAESSGKPDLVSSKGAAGLMQLMEETAQDMGVRNIMDPKENIMGGTKYLNHLLEMYNGDLTLTLAGYNAGPHAVSKYDGVPPYPETQNYVKKVMTYFNQLKMSDSDEG